MRRIIVATAFLAGTFGWTVANATHGDPQVDPKLNASVFNSKLVQAFDECDPSEATTLPDDTLACAGGELDGTPFHLGKVVVKSKVFPSTKTQRDHDHEEQRDAGEKGHGHAAPGREGNPAQARVADQ
ncbi:MAG: hypothetical protein KatS3mg076_0299 [Candidatus Binatia bacterium]|nr:MAG: hypothetical protein KatS3mg076_0299 [Candidatus Binatia bacterium]